MACLEFLQKPPIGCGRLMLFLCFFYGPPVKSFFLYIRAVLRKPFLIPPLSVKYNFSSLNDLFILTMFG